ncbi:peptidyl-prolyl cis-trans isomerase [Paenibacillus oryzisoli]|uniref:peptidylprolyl isomerase n=1 Tax=Paenibacillus oryzisoli TaxID=1850517 RepID=UPI003D2700DB
MIRQALHLFGLPLLLLICIMAGIGTYDKLKNPQDVVVLINGEPVTVAEFNLLLKDNLAYTYAYFKDKYGIDDNQDFWESTYSGENPLSVVKEKTLESLKKIKVQQRLAKEKGVIDEISYSSFLTKWKEENSRRQAAVKSNKVIYGPVQYAEKDYYHYVLSNMITELKATLQSQKEILTSDDVLKRYYEENKLNFRASATKKIEEIAIAYDTDRKQHDAQIVMEMIRNPMNEGQSLKSIMDYFNEKNPSMKISYAEQVWDKTAERLGYRTSPMMQSIVQRLEAGQMSEVFDENGAMHIVRCTESIGGGYLTFDEVKNGLLETYVNLKYDEMIDHLTRHAEVKISDNLYNKIKV